MGRTITNEMAELMMNMAAFTYVDAMCSLEIPREEIMAKIDDIIDNVRKNFVKFCEIEGITDVVGDIIVEEN